jgi:uncharacterized phosphosugar-binding protein
MTAFRYCEAVRDVLHHLESTQAEAIANAAELVVHALRHQGAVFCSEIGHGIQGDFLNRAGGLAALQPLTFGLNVHDPVAQCLANRPRPEAVDREIETVRVAIRTGNLRAGDVVVIGSVSGRNVRPVEIALACRQIGVHTIGLTSLTYTANVASLHPSGKRLCEAVDVVVDIGAPYGDAAVSVPGLDVPVMPVSGVGFAVAGWMIWEKVMERMAAEGDPPTVFLSVNREGGQEYYERARRQFNERGY